MAEAMKEAQQREKCCATCRFWVTRFDNESRGACHRYPPQIISGRLTPPPNAHPGWQPRPEHYFCMTMSDQWCGEYQEHG